MKYKNEIINLWLSKVIKHTNSKAYNNHTPNSKNSRLDNNMYVNCMLGLTKILQEKNNYVCI